MLKDIEASKSCGGCLRSHGTQAELQKDKGEGIRNEVVVIISDVKMYSFLDSWTVGITDSCPRFGRGNPQENII